MPSLFEPLRLRGVTLRNRIGMSPMCQYSAVAGLPQTWHITHLGARASGGAGLVLAEATAVEPRGRISLGDTGLWNEAQREAWRPIVEFIAAQGAVPGIQLAHAGRKAGTAAPWEGGKPYASFLGRSATHQHGAEEAGPETSAPENAGDGARATAAEAWTDEPIAPSPIPFAEGYQTPREMTRADMDAVREAFCHSTALAAEAGFKVLELHWAHGYLLHSFLSPLTNRRGDAYGGELPGRLRFPLELAEAVRAAWPEELPLLLRLSCTDWLAGGWDLQQSLALARRLKELGVDLIDCSSGGTTPESRPPVMLSSGGGFSRPQDPATAATEVAATGTIDETGFLATLYQVPFAEAVRREAAIPSAAVGLITTPQQAEQIVREERADLVLVGRAMLRDPHWALHAAAALGAEAPWPRQYSRARPSGPSSQ